MLDGIIIYVVWQQEEKTRSPPFSHVPSLEQAAHLGENQPPAANILMQFLAEEF